MWVSYRSKEVPTVKTTSLCRHGLIVLVAATLTLPAIAWAAQPEDNRGFLDNPPVFIDNEPDVPLTLMGAAIPNPGEIIPGYDSITESSTEFRRNGVNVQLGLAARFDTRRISALGGISPGWGAAITIPWQHTRVTGNMQGLPTTADLTAIGDLAVFGKKRVWRSLDDRSSIAITGGLGFPTGNANAHFDQSNAATNGYFHGEPKRLPLSWQPGGGAVGGYIAGAYQRRGGRFSYTGILAAKLHTSDGEDATIGNIFVAAASGTYGIARPVAISLSMILRSQANDSYPQAPPPGVDGPLLQGTTNHGTSLVMVPSLRFLVAGRIVIGAGVRIPAINPDDGFVNGTRGFLIIYPNP